MSDSSRVQIDDLVFSKFITDEQINLRVKSLAREIDEKLNGKEVVFLGILNGCFIFMADLVRHCTCDHVVKFIKLSSYEGTESTGKIVSEGQLGEDLKGRHVLLVEDIIDSGLTINWITERLTQLGVASVHVVTLLLKPEAIQHPVQIDYVGFEIPNNFVVGYGLDYNGKGRNLTSIYTLADSDN